MSTKLNQKCKICNGELNVLLTYNNTPEGAQIFKASIQDKQRLIDLDICQCQMCGMVQIPSIPVNYYHKAIRSPDWNMDDFRVSQKNIFIQQFNLYGKVIKYINCQPTVEKYDAFMMFNYLQHFPFPRITLNQIYNNLSQNGVGIIEVPNFDQIIRYGMFGEFIVDHLFYFTKETLRMILQLTGFHVVRIEQIWQGASLSAVVKKRKPLNVSNFITNQQKLIFDIDNYIQKYNKVSIWGAGHRALMILPMLKNIHKIDCLIDDFKLKQKKYTPITNKLIISSQQIQSHNIDAIIIMVGWQYKSVFNRLDKLDIKVNKAIIKKATLEVL